MIPLTIIMYHYVRPTRRMRYGLRVRDTDEFIRQLDYIEENFDVISAEDLDSYISSPPPIQTHPPAGRHVC